MGKMGIKVLFIQRRETYCVEYSPEAVLVANELSCGKNPEWFRLSVQEHLADLGGTVAGHTIARFDVDEGEIRKLCLKDSDSISATLVGGSKEA